MWIKNPLKTSFLFNLEGYLNILNQLIKLLTHTPILYIKSFDRNEHKNLF